MNTSSAPITDAQRLVLDILRASLTGAKASNLDQSDEIWQKAVDWAIRQRVLLLLYRELGASARVPVFVLEQMRQSYRANAVRALRQEKAVVVLRSAFTKEEISFIPIKGLLLSQLLYQDPAIRPSFDIDVFIHERNLDRAQRLLLAGGYRLVAEDGRLHNKTCRRIYHHFAYQHPKSQVVIELHFRLVQRNRAMVKNLSAFWEHTRPIQLSGIDFLIMSPEDTLLYLAIHSAKDDWGSLLQICDMSVLIAQPDKLDWLLLLQLAQRYHCRRRLLLSCALVHHLFALPLPVCVHQAFSRERWLDGVLSQAYDRLFRTDVEPEAVMPGKLVRDLQVADQIGDRLVILGSKAYLALVKRFA